MEKIKHGYSMIYLAGLILSLIAFSACFAAEFKRTKLVDVKLDGKLCYLPGSPAFGLGITASICLSIVQIVGTFIIGIKLRSGEKRIGDEAKKQTIAICLLVMSWITFGVANVLLGATSSMNKRQTYGKGWLNGDCYTVKKGVYICSGFLVLTTVILMVGSNYFTSSEKNKQMEQGKKIHSQLDEEKNRHRLITAV